MKVLVEVFVIINVWAEVGIGTLTDVQVDVTIDVVSDVGVEVLTGVYGNGSVVEMIDLQFVMPTP